MWADIYIVVKKVHYVQIWLEEALFPAIYWNGLLSLFLSEGR